MADRVWHIVSNCIPVHTLYEAVDIDYETVIGNLYVQLHSRGFAPECVECLKKRPRRADDASLSLYDIFCASNTGQTESIFEAKLETMNIWQRYDFESYLMVAAIVSYCSRCAVGITSAVLICLIFVCIADDYQDLQAGSAVG